MVRLYMRASLQKKSTVCKRDVLSVRILSTRRLPVWTSYLTKKLSYTICYVSPNARSQRHGRNQAGMLIFINISVHQQQEVCNRGVWGWGVAYQLETWQCRLDVSPPTKFCYNKVLRTIGCLLLTLLIPLVAIPCLLWYAWLSKSERWTDMLPQDLIAWLLSSLRML